MGWKNHQMVQKRGKKERKNRIEDSWRRNKEKDELEWISSKMDKLDFFKKWCTYNKKYREKYLVKVKDNNWRINRKLYVQKIFIKKKSNQNQKCSLSEILKNYKRIFRTLSNCVKKKNGEKYKQEWIVLKDVRYNLVLYGDKDKVHEKRKCEMLRSKKYEKKKQIIIKYSKNNYYK